MLKPEAAFHLGPELERALNRMDFFRLFKALAGSHDYQYFALAEVLGEEDPFDLHLPYSLHNIPDVWIDGGRGGIEHKDPMVEHLRGSTVACSMDAQDSSSALCRSGRVNSAVVIPLQTAAGKRFGLLMLGNAQRPRHDQLAVIAHDAAVVFQRYFEAILSLDSISGLNDREIQIVRWTSEGKTSVEIAIILGLSEHTVNSYIAAILRKLHVVNRAQMVAFALRSGLIN